MANDLPKTANINVFMIFKKREKQADKNKDTKDSRHLMEIEMKKKTYFNSIKRINIIVL